jgi:hypothetical protein
MHAEHNTGTSIYSATAQSIPRSAEWPLDTSHHEHEMGLQILDRLHV